jgi:hypothetical protein
MFTVGSNLLAGSGRVGDGPKPVEMEAGWEELQATSPVATTTPIIAKVLIAILFMNIAPAETTGTREVVTGSRGF